MGQFIQIDPTTKDYVFENGSPIETDDVRVRTYFSLMIPQNKWLYGQPNQGSLLYILNNVKRTSSIEQQFASLAADAINQQVIGMGYGNDQGIKNIAASSVGTNNEVEVVPSAQPVQSQLNFVSV